MPELPEVETIVRGIRAHVVGREFREVHVERQDVIRAGGKAFKDRLLGRRVSEVGRLGKRIMVHLDGGGLLIVHLGMSGRLVLEPANLLPALHTHLRFSFTGLAEELRFLDPRRFGGVWYLPDGKAIGDLKPLGPDALEIRVPILREITRRSRQIKALLMDQQAISGLGNIYCDEALFAARIHPLTRASRLTENRIKRLACSIRKTLRASIDSGGSTLNDYRQADGSEGSFQRIHRVYDRKGLPCRRCGSKIVKIIAAGRSTHFCPKCQK